MTKTRVAFLGSRPLGAFALRLLMEMENVEVVACVCRPRPANAWWQEDPFDLVQGAAVELDRIAEIDFDLGVSINYWKILSPEMIQKPRLGFINQHHAHNLSLRGRNMTARAILGARQNRRWYHGTCLHYTDDGLDTGPIIESVACDINELDTGWTVFNRCEDIARIMLKSWLPRLVLAKAPVSFPERDHPLQKSVVDLEGYKFIRSLYGDPEYNYDIVRAFDFNGYFEGAFTKIDGQKVHLTTSEARGGETLLDLGLNRKIYRSINQWHSLR